MTVEQGEDGVEGDKFPVQTASYGVNTCSASSSYHSYPPPLATYEDLVCSRETFMESLKKLHASMGTKFMIPIVGGRDLDLHRLFVEVTSRGGIAKILKERKWKEVTAVFSFPSSATNASFILRKYYVSLLYHYEQIYFFKAKCWTPSPTDAMHTLSTITAPPLGLPEYAPSVSQRTHAAAPQQKSNAETFTPEVSIPPSAAGSPVCGVIDGKFESGYLITVKIGMEEFKGVLYQVPNNETQVFQDQHSGMHQTQINHSSLKAVAPRRKRRKKSEIRKRDPAHPKPNRSGYNFFFAEQHARLKPHYHGKDREISRIIGESWNKLQEPERSVYQEKALKDKERYKMEMEVYRERLRTGQITASTAPVQQHTPIPEVILTTDLNSNAPFEGTACIEENEVSTDKSDKSNVEGFESVDKDSDFGECSQAEAELKNVNIEVMANEAFDLETRPDGVGHDDTNFGHVTDEAVLAEDGMSVPVKGIEQPASSNANVNVNESVENL
ncbi:HMG mobility box protein with ARID/BRIGHT DNA-binding domain-containing protein [Perilla frutescens var. hirtella]|uniref:HMG mobility box protein with ARID/BRIGHT DNA-binding domain-containing protein n=1 Tax=Perilla frutescens var. hirtella TaxID=608512 RepID=A0AAD4JF56_PERFH|nr:HMG mobility box protein with ARID/BRIGHT DNA-binding domain-containing protein [Perilla frutescens var. hirtella]